MAGRFNEEGKCSMMNIKRHVIAATAGVSAILMALTGCGGSKAATDSNGKPLVKIAIITPAATQSVKKMKWTKQLEAACDCTIQWQQIGNDAWSQQKNAALAAGDVADITVWGYNKSDFAKNPLFEDLSDDLDKMPNAKKYFKEDAYAKKFATDLQGRIFQIPSSVYERNTALVGGQTMMINKTWLDKLGLQVPKTWDELEQVLKAFKEKDPNGNGKQDEIPFDINALGTTGIGWWSPFLLLNGTGISTQVSQIGGQGLYVKNGKVKDFLTTSNFREVIEYYNKLISEGLVPADALTKASDKYTAEMQNDGKTARVGVAFGWNTSAFGSGLEDQYVTMLAPTAPGAKTTWESEQPDVYNGAAVAKDSPYKEQAFKIINKWLDPDVSMESYYGDKGTYLVKNGTNDYSVKPAAFKDSSVNVSLADRGLTWMRPGVKLHGVTDVDLSNKEWAIYKDVQPKADSKDTMPSYVTMNDTDQNDVSNRNTPIFAYALPQIANWMQKGGLNDSTWKAYVDKLNSLGLQDNVKTWQKWYDKYTK